MTKPNGTSHQCANSREQQTHRAGFGRARQADIVDIKASAQGGGRRRTASAEQQRVHRRESAAATVRSRAGGLGALPGSAGDQKHAIEVYLDDIVVRPVHKPDVQIHAMPHRTIEIGGQFVEHKAPLGVVS